MLKPPPLQLDLVVPNVGTVGQTNDQHFVIGIKQNDERIGCRAEVDRRQPALRCRASLAKAVVEGGERSIGATENGGQRI